MAENYQALIDKCIQLGAEYAKIVDSLADASGDQSQA